MEKWWTTESLMGRIDRLESDVKFWKTFAITMFIVSALDVLFNHL